LAPERVERRLTAILAADVAGYSRLTGLDEEGTHAQLQDHLRSLVDPKITEHRGRVVKNAGDGLLAEFSSVVDAVRCAIDVQRGMMERNADVPKEKRIEFRIGINVGDVMIDHGDIFGDGVNVAARLEGLAEPGGICASGRVLEDVEGKLDIVFENAGEQQLKNIARLVRVYRVRLSGAAEDLRPALPLPDKPSIAVLPFENLSGDPGQDYFADGMVEDIITALSRIRWLFVIARNSSFTYKGRAVDVRQVGRELGVRYVLEGSVRKSANRVRIAGQLIDASNGTHLWADRFDGAIEDVFELQDQMTTSVVGAIAPAIVKAEIDRAKRKPTGSLDAYDCFLRALASFRQWTRAGNEEALRLSYRAIELDGEFALAYGLAAACFVPRKMNNWEIDWVQAIPEVRRLARRAAELGEDDAQALSMAGHALQYVVGDLPGGAALLDRALVLDQNLAGAWFCRGWGKAWMGEPDAALDDFARAERLNPRDPWGFVRLGGMGFAHLLAGRYDQASACAKRSLNEQPSYLPALAVLAASNALAGRPEEAEMAAKRSLELLPTFRVSGIKHHLPFRRPEDLARYEEGLRRAGLPE
jgi:TolB-like protein